MYPFKRRIKSHLLALLGGATIVVVSRLRVNVLQFCFSLSYTGPETSLYIFLSKMFNFFLSLVVSVEVSDAYVNVLSIIAFFSIYFGFLDMFYFEKNRGTHNL